MDLWLRLGASDGRSSSHFDVKPMVARDKTSAYFCVGTIIWSHILWMEKIDNMEEDTRDEYGIGFPVWESFPNKSEKVGLGHK